ncbi:MAG TPA: preprotein translocase subunit YajC [Nocardioides sp.]|uniref:preprotein translocase subunit YajC n=1 Tax=Nocardioides sp. TaxID=35761 RepID=UPI002C82A964|nr:preprotein translocase subunit YajC [Nocardioides sp.]HQR26360.1 preprotein translocase subunit YajC [Nocardioides sp.]
MEQLVSLLPLAGIALVFWLLLIRPASRRNKAMAQLQASLRVGDRVMLSSGIYGTLRTVDEDPIEVEFADGLVVQVARAAVARVVHAEPTDVEPGPDAAEEG